MQKPESHILIIDDDLRILELLKAFFKKHGFLVSGATNSKEAEELFHYFTFDLIILDVMLPNVSGLEFAKSLKSSKNPMPIIMLTALSAAEDRIRGLESGANDYLVKPFEPQELLIRVRNLIESSHRENKQDKIVYFGDMSYNFKSKNFLKDNKSIKLSAIDQKLLEILIESSGKPINRDILSQKIGKNLSLRSVDVQIVRIRGKIESDPKNPQYLKTIRGEGYVLFT